MFGGVVIKDYVKEGHLLTDDLLWPSICNLAGRELKTLARGRAFEVSDVDTDQVTLSPVASGKMRMIQRDILEGAFNALLNRQELTSIEIAEEFSPYKAVYVTALLAALPDIAVCSRPTRLIFMGNQLFYLDEINDLFAG
jgi:hypothetical protein